MNRSRHEADARQTGEQVLRLLCELSRDEVEEAIVVEGKRLQDAVAQSVPLAGPEQLAGTKS